MEPKVTPELDATVRVEDDQTNPSARRGDSLLTPPTLGAEVAEMLAGRYEILGLLGSGGMGAVYKARDVALGELIALKVLRTELSDDAAMHVRFRQEVKLARRVTHPNVARTFDFGEHGPHKFLTMELIVGASLGATLHQRGAPSLARVLEIGAAIAQGLGAAHAAGVVHRDLKPDNVLLGDDGRILITDFGIARMRDPVVHEGAATMGAPLGTPAYMAPEQIEGVRDIDGRADIYALGAILYELLTGVRAWQGDTVYVVAARRLAEPPPDPRDKRPGLAAPVAELVLRCMARPREGRFQTAEEVVAALHALETPSARVSLLPSMPLGAPQAPSLVATKSVAVLPFRNGGAPSDAYLADGLTDDLIDVLSMTPGLRVCGRGVVMARALAEGDPRRVGEDLQVEAVVEGSIRRSDDRLRVTARVLSVSDGFQLWAQRFDRREAEFFEVNDAVARAVAEALTCTSAIVSREAPTDPLALDLYLRARHEYFKWWRENVILSLRLFEQALERAPNDPMILAGYAMALCRRCGQDDSDDSYARAAGEAAERALSLAPDSAPARIARAHVYLLSGRSAEAAQEVERVLRQNPRSADAADLAGRLFAESGPPERAIHFLERALELEPGAVTATMEIARLHALASDKAASDAFFGDEPAHPGLSNIYWVHRCRAALLLGDTERARAWRKNLESRHGMHPGVGMMLRALTGDLPTSEELQALMDLAARGTQLMRRRAFYAQIVCEFAASFGRRDVALSALEIADEGAFFDAVWLDRCGPLAVLRGEPRFLAVAARVRERAARVREELGVAS
jgi:serine/threonine-protein kinase